MSTSQPATIVLPGDEPVQLTGTPQLEQLRQLGRVVVYDKRPASDAEKVERLAGAEILVNSRGSVTWPGNVLAALQRLKFITTCGIGTDAIDLEAAARQGIVVSNIPGVTAPIVAEHALALLLAAARRTSFLTRETKQGRWTRIDNVYLAGKTLGVVGLGPIGGQLARLARAIGMDVIAWTFHPTPERAREWNLEFVELDDLLRRSDAVSIHLKLTPESRHRIGARELGLMKRGSLLVNTARGAIVDTRALIDALHRGQLAGAGLDVFESEPLAADDPLLACEQVVLTPHVADQNPEGMNLLNDGVVANVRAFLEGKPRNVVTPK